MARIARRAQQRRNKNIFWGVIALLVALSVIGTVAYFIFNKPEGRDPQTLCPVKGPRGHVVLLVDKTDPLNSIQKESFDVTLREVVEKQTAEDYLLSVFVLGEDFKENAKPLIELCNPGTGDNKSELTSNLKQLHHQYKERFLEPLLKQSSVLTATQPAKTSPIFEMLQLASINAFRKRDIKGPRKLIVISDMLHNTPQFSMYRGQVDYSDFAASSYGKKSQLELLDVDVQIHYLMNSPQLQTKRNVRFWEEYFNKAGARLISVRPLEG